MAMTDAIRSDEPATARYSVAGMDCASCVAQIEAAARQVPGVDDVRVSLATQTMTVNVRDAAAQLTAVERAVAAIGHPLSRIDDTIDESDGDDLARDLRQTMLGYKRALWIVVVLNVGYSLVEIVAGFVARSQALQADSLDFLGDGLISLLGLLAINWRSVWRARSALIQGLFLGALGLSVLAGTIYRVFVLNEPEAELMGVFGLIALLVNVAAALLLIPHRAGDANVRAVWLFSRNDAIGNLAVIVAALLVAWTSTPWPDLIVAMIVASLFLHSSWSIIKDARREARCGSWLAA